MPAWAVPTTGRFYKPLRIWFPGSIKHLAGKKSLEVFWKVLVKDSVSLSFISFLCFLLLCFNPTQVLQLRCVKEKEGRHSKSGIILCEQVQIKIAQPSHHCGALPHLEIKMGKEQQGHCVWKEGIKCIH